MYYRNAQSALVVYDLTKATSLIKAKHWVAELQRQASPGIVIALVGNKLDLTTPQNDAEETTPNPRAISTEEAKAYADEEGLLFFETSAKTGEGVKDVFEAIAGAIPESTLKPRGGGVGGGLSGGRGGAGSGGLDGSSNSAVNLVDHAMGVKEGCAC